MAASSASARALSLWQAEARQLAADIRDGLERMLIEIEAGRTGRELNEAIADVERAADQIWRLALGPDQDAPE